VRDAQFREQQNFLESEITLLEPRPVLDGPGLGALTPSYLPSRSILTVFLCLFSLYVYVLLSLYVYV
jgi:hypothetical protein